MSECKLGPCGYHCNCFNDIDWDKPGCQWCQLITDEQKHEEMWAEDRAKLKATLLQVNELRKLMGHWSTVELALKAQEETNRLLRELQERYDIYAKHLKTCAVYIGQEIPCDCGFICGTGMPFGQSGVPDFCTKPKPCPEHSSKNEKRNDETCACLHDISQHVKTQDGQRNECLASDCLGRSICKCMVYMAKV